MGQHLVEVVQHVLQKFALRPGLDGGEKEIAEGAAVPEEEDRQEWYHQEQPGLLGNVSDAQPDSLRQLRDLVAMRHQERLDDIGAGFAPAVVGSEFGRDLAGTELGQQVGQSLSQPRTFAGYHGSNNYKKHHDQSQEQSVDHRDRPVAS